MAREVGGPANVRAEDVEIEAWLVDQRAERLVVARASIDRREPFASDGLTSREAVVPGTRPPIDAPDRYPTLDGLAQWRAEAGLAEHEHAS